MAQPFGLHADALELGLLADEKLPDEDHGVPKIGSRTRIFHVLAERTAGTDTDECASFRPLIDAGRGVGDVPGSKTVGISHAVTNLKTARAGGSASYHDVHIAIEAGLVHQAYVGESKFLGNPRLLRDLFMAETSTGRNTKIELRHSFSHVR